LAPADVVRWQVRTGRRLRWSPPWDDGGGVLVFDGASGDYWVLSPAANGLLRGAAAGHDVPDDAASLDLLAEMQRSGLITDVN
jgi:hypothetical protein